jgi:hypothetical protein
MAAVIMYIGNTQSTEFMPLYVCLRCNNRRSRASKGYNGISKIHKNGFMNLGSNKAQRHMVVYCVKDPAIRYLIAYYYLIFRQRHKLMQRFLEYQSQGTSH